MSGDRPPAPSETLTWKPRSTRSETMKAAYRLEKPEVQKPAGNEVDPP